MLIFPLETANLGGVMSLCLGFSLLSLIEVIYFFTLRQMNNMKRFKEEVTLTTFHH